MNTIPARPKLNIEPSPTDRVVEVATLVGLGVLVVATAYYWPSLPATIPTSFDFAGNVRAQGPKATLLIFPVVGVLMYILFGIVSRFPHTCNYPVPITEDNAERQYRIAVSAIRWLKLEVVWLLACLNWQVIQMVTGKSKGHELPYIVVALTATMIVTTVVLVVRSYRAR